MINLDPYDPMCKRFAREMEELDSFWPESREDFEAVLPVDRPGKRLSYVIQEEGTLNRENGHFLCDKCYIAAGQPSSPTGWVCP